MQRRKTTVYLEAEVLSAAKMVAAARESSESQVVEDALRAYLRAGELGPAGADLRALMDRIAGRDQPDEDTAMALAVDEVQAVRPEQGSTPGS